MLPISPRRTVRAAQFPSLSLLRNCCSGCVVFIRHALPDTNKTALRAPFSALLADDDNDNVAALNYVDYTRGLDTVLSVSVSLTSDSDFTQVSRDTLGNSFIFPLTMPDHALLPLKRFEQPAGEEIALESLYGR
jgi:hypothetical protein